MYEIVLVKMLPIGNHKVGQEVISGEIMDNRKENREDIKMDLSFVFKKKEYSAKTVNLSNKGCAIEFLAEVHPPTGKTLQLAGEFRKNKHNFSAMVKWYQKELHRNIMGLQIINPPAQWNTSSEKSKNASTPIFQLHFGNIPTLEDEYHMHLTKGFLEVSPTPRVPSLNAPIIVEVFLPGQLKPERISGRVTCHTAGGFNVRLVRPEMFLKKVKQVIA